MDVALSDLLTCPRCGPTHGLILLPDDVRDRRVISGVLGCANCRERYPVAGGVADLRVGGAGPDTGPSGAAANGAAADSATNAQAGRAANAQTDPEAMVRFAALLGLGEGAGTVLIAGPGSAHAAELAAMLDDVSVIAADHQDSDTAGVSVLRVGATIPLRGGSLRGVALTGERAGLLEEGARLLGAMGRLLLDPAPNDASARARAAGLRVLLEQDSVLVAGRGR